MNLSLSKIKILTLLAAILAQIFIISENVFCTPPTTMYNAPIYLNDARGINPFPDPVNDAMIVFDLMPYYQNANSSRNFDGIKVQTGDRLGRWFMIGLLEGTNASPGVLPGGIFNPVEFPLLAQAQKVLTPLFQGQGVNLQDNTFTNSRTFGYYSVPVDYEQIGIREKLRLNFGHGLGAQASFGIAEYRQEPEFIDLTTTNSLYGFTLTSSVEYYLMTRDRRNAIGREINLSFAKYSTTGLEDLHVQLHWNGSFPMENDRCETVVNLIPYVAVGAWIPTGKKQNEDIAFSLPLGNEVGAFTLEGCLNFDFPGILQLGFGGAIAVWGSRTSNFRIPSALPQSNIYPWKIRATKKYGFSWNIHADFCAIDFLDKLSFYLNFIYTKKEKDHFTLKGTPEQNALFIKSKREREGQWESKKFFFGFDYKVTKNVALGIGVLAPITEERAYRTITIIGTIRFLGF